MTLRVRKRTSCHAPAPDPPDRQGQSGLRSVITKSAADCSGSRPRRLLTRPPRGASGCWASMRGRDHGIISGQSEPAGHVGRCRQGRRPRIHCAVRDVGRGTSGLTAASPLHCRLVPTAHYPYRWYGDLANTRHGAPTRRGSPSGGCRLSAAIAVCQRRPPGA